MKSTHSRSTVQESSSTCAKEEKNFWKKKKKERKRGDRQHLCEKYSGRFTRQGIGEGYMGLGTERGG